MGAAHTFSVIGSKGGDKPHDPVESPDSLINTSYANILDAISEGPIVGLVNGAQSIFYNETPLANADGSLNFSSVTWEQRTGEAEQDYISGFPAVESETAVGVELKFDQSWTQGLSNTELSAVRVRLGVSTLYFTEDDGDTVGYVVDYAIDLSTDGGDYVTVMTPALDGKTTNGYQRTHRIDLPKAMDGWQIRVRRLTPDSTDSKIQANTSIVGYTEVIDAKLQYPYTALIGSKIDASQFSNIPERAFRIKGRIVQVPTNYDPATRTYSGSWDGTFKLAWTDNPAWIYRDLILNDRYGLGSVISSAQVDRYGLYQIASYCDELVSDGKGGMEPRFTCNLYLQSRANALTVLQDMASIFRGMSYYAGSEVMVSADMPSDPDFTYTNANVIDGKFSRAGSSGSTRYTVAKVSWSDRDNFGEVKVEYVQNQKGIVRYGIRETELTAFGCTSQGQAQRLGQYTLLTNQLETDTISFSVGLDGTIARPGQLVRVSDEHYIGKRMSGRIKSATADTVTMDAVVDASAGDTLVVIRPNGKAETRVIQSVAGLVVTVTESFSSNPTAQSVFAIESAEVVSEVYRILTVAENFGDDKLQYDIVGVQHSASKFAAIDNGAQIVTLPTTVLPSAVQAIPTGVELSTFDSVKQGLSVATMRITWKVPDGAVNYNVWWRKGSSDWVYGGVTYTNSLEVPGIYTGTYTARVSAIGVGGNSSLWGYSDPTELLGKTGTPPSITSLTATSLLFGIQLNWTFPPGAEDTQRTEIWYGPANDLDAATKLTDLAYPQSDYSMQQLKAGATLFFWARLVDRTGNIGPFYPVKDGVVGQASADATAVLELLADQITKSQLGQELLSEIDKIELIDGNGPGSVNDRIDEAKTEIEEQVGAVNDAVTGVRNDLAAQVVAINSDVETVRGDLAEQVGTLNGAITSTKNSLQTQINAISDTANALTYVPTKTYATGDTVRVGQRLYQAAQAVPINTTPPNATYWFDVGSIVVASNGLASRVSTAENKIASIEGVNTAQSTNITGLQSSLTTTNGNVTAAQQAANAANTLAGGKGKVIVQSAAPAAADQLAQNLWIDTTNNANTPKRWTGSVWAAVTDKAATDAATAAAAALTLAKTKADATAVNSLTTRVTTAEDAITSQGESITGLKGSIAGKADSSTVAELSNTVTQQGSAITAQGQSLTNITANLGEVGGENLLFNPSFDSLGDSTTVADGWGAAAPVGVELTRSVVTSTLDPQGKAQRIDVSGLSSGTYADVSPELTRLPAASAGQVLTCSVYVRGTAGLYAQLYMQARNSANTSIATTTGSYILMTGEWQRVSLTASTPLPTDTIAVNPILRVRNGPVNAGFMEWDRAQLQVGTVATGWQDNTGALAKEVSANAEATSALTGRVGNVEGAVTSQSQSITNLTNSVSGKADADAVTSLSNRVTATEGKNAGQDATLASQGQSITSLNNSVAGKADAQAVTSLTNRVTAAEGVNTSQAGQLTTLNNAVNSSATGLNTKASAATVAALTNRVAATETGLTSTTENVTSLTNSINDVGSENLLINPSFEKENATTGLAWRWSTGFANGATGTRSLIASTLDPAGKAQRIDAAGLSTSGYVDLTPEIRPAVSAGQQVALSAYFRAATGLYGIIYIQFRDAAGNNLGTQQSLYVTATGDWQRLTKISTKAPEATASVTVLLRALGVAATPVSGFFEWDRAQLEIGDVVTGWRDSGGVLEGDLLATSNAVASLTSTVTQQGTTLTSQGQSITGLNNNLTTTNTNVTAAQAAAQAATDKAGSKGEVIYSATAPAAEKRLPQNLWIDTVNSANTPKRWNGSAWVAVTDKVAIDAASAAASALSKVATKAEASTVQALTNTVTQQGSAITAQGQSLTNITASLGDIGGQNLLYNPSFDAPGGSTTVADGWAVTAPAGVTVVPSLAASTLDPKGKAQRIDVSGLAAVTYADLTQSAIRLPPASEGQSFTLSVYVRGTAGLYGQLYLQVRNASNATIATTTGSYALMTGEWQRIILPIGALTPATTVGITPILRTRNGPVNAGFMEFDRAQLQAGTVATGWQDNTSVLTEGLEANSDAVESLTSTVTQQGTTLSSQGQSITNLSNAINSPTNGLATKASAASVNTLTQRVASAEGSLTSQSLSITGLTNSVGDIQSAIGASGLDPAPNGLWNFDSTAEGWGLTGGTMSFPTAGAMRVTATSGDPILQKSGLAISGALYNKVRVSITRRAGGTADWDGTCYYATSGHGTVGEYRKSVPNPVLAVGQSTVVEFDMASLSAGGDDWIKSTITAVRLDIGSTSGGAFDIDWIAVGRSGPSASSSALDALTSTVTQQGTNLTSASTRVTQLENTINSTSNGLATKASSSALSSLDSKVTQQGTNLTAQTTRIDGLYTSVGNTNSAIQTEATTRANADSAQATQITNLQSSVTSANNANIANTAAIKSEATTRANADSALSSRVDGVQSIAGEARSNAQTAMNTAASVDGKVSSSIVNKVQVTVNGIHYNAGFAVGADYSGGTVQTTFAVNA